MHPRSPRSAERNKNLPANPYSAVNLPSVGNKTSNKWSGSVGTSRSQRHNKGPNCDDVYDAYRKDAVKMTKAASGHSIAAKDSYNRGDYAAAKRFSEQAREERAAAKKLNEKACREILETFNSENGIWKLDLHGLHAKEALQVLQERLQKIESRVSLRSIAANFLSYIVGKKLDEEASDKQTTMILEVVTGRGNHSKGAPVLPGEVKRFLIEKGYCFDDRRPGVIMICTKVRPVMAMERLVSFTQKIFGRLFG